jgi:hypothetical protein
MSRVTVWSTPVGLSRTVNVLSLTAVKLLVVAFTTVKSVSPKPATASLNVTDTSMGEVPVGSVVTEAALTVGGVVSLAGSGAGAGPPGGLQDMAAQRKVTPTASRMMKE